MEWLVRTSAIASKKELLELVMQLLGFVDASLVGRENIAERLVMQVSGDIIV